jgi:hypothetical protein
VSQGGALGTHRARAGHWQAARVCALVLAVWSTTASAQTRGSITLAWDPNPEPEVIGYTVFVGTESGVYTDRYDAGPDTTFVYRAPVDAQRYYFAVAAYSERVVGALSEEVSATTALTGSLNVGARSVNERAASDGCSAECSSRTFRARGLGSISSLAPSRDDRLFFIEDQRHIRVALAGGEVTPPILSTGGTARFVGLSLASDFGQSGFVFVGVDESRADGTRDLSIVRYREVQNRLGEPAVIIGGLRLWTDQAAPFDVGPDGHIYVAMPVTGRQFGDPYAGYLLSFDGQGRVPAENRGGSPVLAHGFAAPVAVEVSGGDVWLVGADAGWQRSMARVAPHPEADAEWPRVPSGIRPGASGATADAAAPARAFATSDTHGGTQFALVVDVAGRLQAMQSAAPGTLEHLRSLDWYPSEMPVAVAIGIRNEVFVAFRQPDGTFAIEEIAPQ